MYGFIVTTSFLYVWYRIAMWFLGRRHAIRSKSKALYFVVIVCAAVGVVMDVIYNFTFGSLIFVQLPSFRRPTLSQRMKHIRRTYNGKAIASDIEDYRYKLASYICKRVLNPHDPDGRHC